MVAGGIVGVTTADADGNVQDDRSRCRSPPETGPSKHDKGYEIALVQGALTASATFRSARVVRRLQPRQRATRATLRVRFSAYGFGVATAAGQPMPKVYVHYVDPKGKVAPHDLARDGHRAVRHDRAGRRCASCSRSAARGKWTLQFDTQPAPTTAAPASAASCSTRSR